MNVVRINYQKNRYGGQRYGGGKREGDSPCAEKKKYIFVVCFLEAGFNTIGNQFYRKSIDRYNQNLAE